MSVSTIRYKWHITFLTSNSTDLMPTHRLIVIVALLEFTNMPGKHIIGVMADFKRKSK